MLGLLMCDLCEPWALQPFCISSIHASTAARFQLARWVDICKLFSISARSLLGSLLTKRAVRLPNHWQRERQPQSRRQHSWHCRICRAGSRQRRAPHHRLLSRAS